MHIAAVMAALEVWELDRNAKHALVCVACRASKAGAARISVERVAADMKVGYYCAGHALQRAVEAGFLTVDKSGGRAPLWRLSSAIQEIELRDPGNEAPRSDRGAAPRSRPRTKDSLDKSKEGVAARTRDRRAAPPGDNGARGGPARPDFAAAKQLLAGMPSRRGGENGRR